ncbi:YhdT family protein [Dorea acetigenes]|uniref:YhdT family protein n=1 Tax=Dorea acetigenes TaxID=2981787 RepID=A0ABT2RQA9_9FIRM|nr:YhdT family protein [Dorea acetigenes]MCB6415778.1 YhdT family protein [Faecalimonas umbilicata]MCU6687319.1 YhdT family protein [Dorea acetigenes]SCJ36468.1 Predicted membrane protein [uncultured Clostridium sp.]
MGKTEEIHIIDDKSRDYNIKDIETDPRFTQTTKEFWITLGVYVAFAALMIANLLILNGNKSLVLGFPLWIFMEILIIIGFVAAVIILSTYVYKDMDITPSGEIYKKPKKKKSGGK